MFELHVDFDEAVIDPFDPGVVRARGLTVDTIVDWLGEKGVEHGIDRAAIGSMIEMAAGRLKAAQAIVVARATQPGEGAAARLEVHFQTGQIVGKGDVLAVKHPPQAGRPGIAVTGEELPGIPGDEMRMRPGVRTSISSDGLGCVAATYGVVKVEADVVDVEPLVQVSEDGMVALVDVYPRTDSGRTVDLQTLKDALRHEGVVFGVDEAALAEAVAQASSSGFPVQSVAGARAKEAVPGQDTRFDYKFRISGRPPEEADAARSGPGHDRAAEVLDLVKSGDVVAVKIPMREPDEGKTVRGERIECPPVRNVALVPRDHIEVGDDQVSYRATIPVCGYVHYEDHSIRVASPLEVDEQAMEATLSVYPPGSNGVALDRLLVERLLTSAGVVYGIDWEIIDRILAEVAETGQPALDRVVARGKPALPGSDGRIDFKVDIEKRVGTRREDGSIDFREQGTIKNVEPGEILVEVVPPEEGQAGRTIKGQEIPARSGRRVNLQAAQNVEVSEDGRVFKAAIGGMLLVTKTHVGVFDSYQVDGDVDYETGNIRFDQGSVSIAGSVGATFSVSAKSHVFVKDTVNDSVITCRGDVDVGRGIVMAGKGYIKAGGSVRCLFAHNARIWAEGDIEIHSSAVNSQLVAGGHLTIAGKGRLIGGTAKAREGIRCVDLGSEMAVETQIVVGRSFQEIEQLKEQISRLTADVAKIEKALGADKTLEDLYLYPAEKREIFRKLILYRDRAVETQTSLTRRREQLISETKNKKLASIQVEGTSYPGVTVTILDRVWSIDKEMKHIRIFYDRQRDEITTEPLRT